MKHTFILSLLLFLFPVKSFSEASQNYFTKKIKIDGRLFRIHYPKDRLKFLNETISVLKKDVHRVNNYFDYHANTPVDIEIKEYSSQSNGSATVFPQNKIVLYDFPPEGFHYLNLTKDWQRNLITHEYVHIVSMEMATKGMKTLKDVFGNIIIPNAVMPRWFLEGVATWYESNLVKGEGRLQQKEVLWQVYKFLDDNENCNELSCLDSPRFYPFATASYWVGAAYLDYLETIKVNSISCIVKAQSGKVPFFLNESITECMGMDSFSLYNEFRNYFMTKNINLRGFCPVGKTCKRIEQAGVNLARVNFQKGVCSEEDDLFLSVFERSSHLSKKSSFKIYKISKNNLVSQVEIEQPYRHIKKVAGRCIVEGKYLDGDDNLIKETTVINNTNLYNEEKIEDDRLLKNAKDGEEAYSGTSYLTPKYWLFFLSSASDELTTASGMTSFSDPLNYYIGNINLVSYWYKNVAKDLGGDAQFSFAKYDWKPTISFAKYFEADVQDSQLNDYNITAFQLSRSYIERDYMQLNRLIGQSVETRDFLSAKKYTKSTYRYQFTLMPQYNSLFNVFDLQLGISNTETIKPYESKYTSYLAKLATSIFISDRVDIKLKSSWGKQNKNNLLNGTLNVGGSDSFFAGTRSFPVNGLAYQKFFGNEALTSMVSVDVDLLAIYKGKKLWPVFIKNIGLELGVEYAKSDLYIHNKSYLTNQYYQGLFAKMYSNISLMYLWNTKFSFIATSSTKPVNDSKVFFNFEGSLF